MSDGKGPPMFESILLSFVFLGLIATCIAGWAGAAALSDRGDGGGVGAGVCLLASAVALGVLVWTLVTMGRDRNVRK